MILGKHVNRYYLRYALWLLFGLAALILVDYMQLEIPKLYRILINGMDQGTIALADGTTVAFNLETLLDVICMPMIKIILAIVAGRFLWRLCFFGTAVKVEADLRGRMFSHAKDLSREYYQVNKVGDLMSLFTNDLDTIQESFGWGVMMLFDAVFLGLLAILEMAKMNLLLTALSLIPMAFLLASAIILGNHLSRKWDVRQEAYAKLSDFSQESFSGIAVVKAFVKEGKELMAFRRLNQENEEANVSYTRSSVLMRIMVTLFVESVICVILGYGGYLVYTGQFNAGQVVEFMGYFNAIVWPIMAVSELIDMSSRGKASLKRVSQLLDAPIHVQDAPDAKDLTNPTGALEFKNLSFRYPGGEFDALENISFTVQAGQSVGIVGRTGSGKSTLVDLILRTYNVPDGTVFLDGQDVNRLTIQSVRAACAYVPQDNFLFSDTIANNIAFGVDSYDKDRIREIAKLADLDGNVQEFAMGYDTILGERGVTVSGGQKQRISIARALMKDAPILILDDSVSAVDTQTEKTILNNLKQYRAGKTTLLIAHRISTVESMDQILFLEEGRLLAAGSHETLLKTCPEYAKMVALQQLEEEGAHHA